MSNAGVPVDGCYRTKGGLVARRDGMASDADVVNSCRRMATTQPSCGCCLLQAMIDTGESGSSSAYRCRDKCQARWHKRWQSTGTIQWCKVSFAGEFWWVQESRRKGTSFVSQRRFGRNRTLTSYPVAPPTHLEG
jgi:hypothetical protein